MNKNKLPMKFNLINTLAIKLNHYSIVTKKDYQLHYDNKKITILITQLNRVYSHKQGSQTFELIKAEIFLMKKYISTIRLLSKIKPKLYTNDNDQLNIEVLNSLKILN